MSYRNFFVPLVLLSCLLLLLAGGLRSGGSAHAADPSISVTTDRYLYHPGDRINFSISLDGAGQNLAGKVVLKVFSAASAQYADPFSGEPLIDKAVDSVDSDSPQASFGLEADSLEGTGGYPVRVSLVDADGRELLAANTWVAVADPGKHDPVDLVMVGTIGSQPLRNTAGQFESTALLDRCEQGNQQPDSLLQFAALQASYPGVKTTYAVEPSMLEQLEAMASGFDLDQGGTVKSYAVDSAEASAASGCLQSLRQLAAGDAYTEIVASPYTFTDLPLLAKEGWDDGLGQFRIGGDVLTDALQLKDVPKGSFAPDLDVTTDSLRYIAATGGEYTVLAGSTRTSVEGRPGTQGATTYRLRDLSGERLTALFADDGASQGLFGNPADPGRFFAVLANAYRSATPSRLVIAAAPAPVSSLTAQKRGKVFAAISQESWIHTMTLGEARTKYAPSTLPSTLLRYNEPVTGYISQVYYQKLEAAHALFESFRAGVTDELPELNDMSRKLFSAESLYLAGQDVAPEQANRGMALINDVQQQAQSELARLSISISTPLFQGSGDGEATVTLNNQNVYPFTADIAIEGGDTEFPEGATQRLQLDPGSTELKIPYNSAGWARLKASIQSNGSSIAEDGATVHPVAGRVWIVAGVAGFALIGGILYTVIVIRRRV